MPTSKKKKKVLVIEDDVFLRDIITRMLDSHNYHVLQAETGEEALTMLEKEEPDIILLDIILPGIDGFEVLREIKEDNHRKHIPVIIISNYGEKEHIEKGRALGAEDYIIKANIYPQELAKRIHEIIDGSQS